jgi:hypothetical protein
MPEGRGFSEERHHEEADDRHEREDRRDDDDDDGDDGDDHLDDDDSDSFDHRGERSRGPRAKLRIRSVSETGMGLEWIKLDARKSKDRDGFIESYGYGIKDNASGQELYAPGASASRVANVLLSPGRYTASVTVTDNEGKTSTKSRRVVIRGKPIAGFSDKGLKWGLGKRWRVGDATLRIQRPTSLLPPGTAVKYHSQDYLATGGLLGAGVIGDCDPAIGRIFDAGDGIGIGTGVLMMAGVTGRALSPINAVGGSLKFWGRKKHSNCINAEIDALVNLMLAMQREIEELQVQMAELQLQLDLEILDLEGQITTLESLLESESLLSQWHTVKNDLTLALGNYLEDLRAITGNPDQFGLHGDFMEQTRLWPIVFSGSEDLPPVDLQANSEDDHIFENTQDFARNQKENFGNLLRQISGTKVMGADTGGGCITDCYKNVGPELVSLSKFNYLLHVWSQYLDLKFRLYTEQEGDGLNGVVLFEEYNEFVTKIFQQSVIGLQILYNIESTINQMNLWRWNSNNQRQRRFRNDADPEQIQRMTPVGGIYYASSTVTVPAGVSPAQAQADAYSEAQKQLNRLYAARFTQLYKNTLGYLFTDTPLNPQAYPAPSDPAWANLAINFELEIGSRLPMRLEKNIAGTEYVDVPMTTPIKMLPPIVRSGSSGEVVAYASGMGYPRDEGNPYVPNTLSASKGWTTNGILYQYSGLRDPYACFASLRAYNEIDHGENGSIFDALTEENCPVVFQLDGRALNEGHFDNATVYAYTNIPPTAGVDTILSHCPTSCLLCDSGQDDGGIALNAQGICDGNHCGYAGTCRNELDAETSTNPTTGQTYAPETCSSCAGRGPQISRVRYTSFNNWQHSQTHYDPIARCAGDDPKDPFYCPPLVPEGTKLIRWDPPSALIWCTEPCTGELSLASFNGSMWYINSAGEWTEPDAVLNASYLQTNNSGAYAPRCLEVMAPSGGKNFNYPAGCPWVDARGRDRSYSVFGPNPQCPDACYAPRCASGGMDLVSASETSPGVCTGYCTDESPANATTGEDYTPGICGGAEGSGTDCTWCGHTAGTEFNECDTDNGGCDLLTSCTNTLGGRDCGDCPAGFTGTGEEGCVAVNVTAYEWTSPHFTEDVATNETVCSNWTTFRAGASGDYNRVTVSSSLGASVTCTDPAAATAIAAGFVVGEFDVSCDGRQWTMCSRIGGEFWIDPPELCSPENCPGLATIIRPCRLPGPFASGWGAVEGNTCGATSPTNPMTVRFE